MPANDVAHDALLPREVPVFPGNKCVFSSITDLQGPSISQGFSTQEKGSEPGLCFQGFGTKGSVLKLGHNAMGIEPLLNGSSFSPRDLTEACRVLRSQGSAGRSLSAHPGVGPDFQDQGGVAVVGLAWDRSE